MMCHISDQGIGYWGKLLGVGRLWERGEVAQLSDLQAEIDRWEWGAGEQGVWDWGIGNR